MFKKILMMFIISASGINATTIQEYTQEDGYDIDRYVEDSAMVDSILDYYSKNVGDYKPEYNYYIMEASVELAIDPKLLALIIGNESSYRRDVKHRRCKVSVYKANTKGVKHKVRIPVRAIGMGGVIYEVWKDKLNEIGIDREMLKDPEHNIRAIAMILRNYMDKSLVSPRGITSSALMRYYGLHGVKGSYSHTYPNKIFSLLRKIKHSKYWV